jgi:menaquinone-dependent protoporphyrinogen oxidase
MPLMKTLIVYMTHHGTTKKVVARLLSLLGENATSVNLEENHEPDLQSYACIIVGGSIHIGQIQGRVKNFCETYKSELLNKKLGLFLCFMNKEMAQQEFENAFSAELRAHATAQGLFGGELLFEKMNFLERFMTRMIAKENKSRSAIDYEAIETFAKAIQ